MVSYRDEILFKKAGKINEEKLLNPGKNPTIDENINVLLGQVKRVEFVLDEKNYNGHIFILV